MGEFQMQPLGGSKRHMSVGSSAKTRNDAKAVVKSAKISSTNKVNKGEVVYAPGSRSSGHVTDDAASCAAEANKENASGSTSSNSARRRKKLPSPSVFGYDIDDINNFLSQATARTPANIPMVVTSRTELYVLAPAATPEDPTVPIRLGLVVNALFKHRQWLYVQTPHNQEGYLAYSACTPLGIIPRGSPAGPWEDAGDAPPRRPEPVDPVSSAPSSDQEDRCRPGVMDRTPLRPLPPALDSAQDSSDSADCCERPPPRRPADRPALKPPPAADNFSLELRANKTDTEKMYENVTSDGRALGLLLEMQLRQGRGRHRSRARSQSAGREPGRRGRSKPRRDASAPGDERSQTGPSDVLDLSQPSAFHPLRPCWPPAARSLEALRRAEVAPPRGGGHLVAPRSNNKAVIWDGFASRGRNTLTVKRGDIVILLNTSVGEWFWVKDAVGREGYIPSVCVRSGLK